MKTNTINTTAAKGAKGNFLSLTGSQAATIAAALLRKYGSRQAIKGHGAELIAKYGRDNYKAIDKAVREQRAGAIEAETAKARAGVREWERAAREAMAAAKAGGHFAKLAAMASAKYATAAEFVAACYPNTIDGAPATLVQYVTGEPGACTIVAAYQKSNIDGRDARRIMDICLGKLEQALKKANKGGKCFAAPAIAREAGKVVAAYNVKPGGVLGTIAKAAPVEGEAMAAYCRGNVAGLTPLAAYNAEARKAYELAAAAEAMAALTGEALSPEAAAILAREPRHAARVIAPKAAKAPKGGKGKAKAPKAPKVSPEAAKAAREGMASVEATIVAGIEAGRELSGAAERERKAIAAAEAKAEAVAKLAAVMA